MTFKNISKIIICFALISAVGSCTKKLELNPRQSIIATDALKSPSDVEAAVVGMYSLMGAGALYGTSLLMDADIQPSSGYSQWRGTFTQFLQVANKTMNRDNGEAARVWTAAYQTINQANIVIDALTQNIVTDPDQKNQFEGEALFARAAMHFELVRWFAKPWGATAANDHVGVVIRTSATKREQEAFARTPRSTVAQVYTAVIADLIAAISKLPDDNGTRVDRYTAQAFLARVYLQQSDYALARDAADAVIQSGKYAMNASVSAVFDNKNTDESIWEIQQNEQNNAGNSNDGLTTFYASMLGIGRGDVRVQLAFRDSYDLNDRRRAEWYYTGFGARPGGINSGKWKSFSQNIPIIRIAEMYLIRAETNIRLLTTVGDLPMNDLAQISNPVRTNLPVNPAPTLADVLSQRNLELAFEGFRIHDIKRLRLATGTFQWDSDRLVFPIPQREVDATQGVIVQNPTY